MKIVSIILLLVLVFVVAYSLFGGMGREILINLGLISGITPQEQEISENAFDIVVRNLENCKALEKTNCLCEIFPSWPATFSQNYKLTISLKGKNTTLNLIHGKKTYKNATLENVGISAQILDTEQFLPLSIEKTLDWKDEPPLYLEEGYKKYRVLSHVVYKSAQPNILYLLITNKPKERFSELEPRLKELKSCNEL